MLLLPAVGVGMRSGLVTVTESTEPVTSNGRVLLAGSLEGAIETL
jgi:hypothetical protein